MTINPHTRLRNSFAEVVKRQAGELVDLARDARTDPAVREALCFELDRIAGTAASLGLSPIERAARAALAADDDEHFLELVQRLVDASRALEGIAPLFRPIVVIGLTKVRAEDLAVELRPAADVGEALALAEAEDPGAFVVPHNLLEALQARLFGALKAVPLFVVGPPGDLDARLAAVRGGAVAYLGAPVRLDHALDQVRARPQDVDPPPSRVLLVEPDLGTSQVLLDTLSGPGRQVHVIHRMDALLGALDGIRPDLVLVASRGKDLDGADVAAVIHSHDVHGEVPVLMMVHDDDLERVALVAGAEDIVRKPVSPAQLRGRVLARLRRAREADAARVVDRLSGTLSRRALLRQADREISLARRSGQGLSVVLLDIDNMGDLNQRLGLGRGDAVLEGLGRLLRKTFRDTDIVGRVGGDSFAVLMPACHLDNARRRVEVVREGVHAFGRELDLPELDMSIGIADTSTGIVDVLARADRALLQARNDGGGRICLDPGT